MSRIMAPPLFFSNLRYGLVVLLICYIPYCVTAPLWLLGVILVATSYRLGRYYLGLKPYKLPFIIQLILSLACLLLLKADYGTMASSNFYIGFLLAFVGLKILEINSERDLRILVFCNFYLIFAALILTQELWIIAYMIIAILANLSLMIKMHAPAASIKQIGSNSFKQALIAMPMCLLLFYLFPRIEHPLWRVPAQTQAPLGFSEKMTLDSMLNLANSAQIAFRVIFNSDPIFNGYWTGLILNFYNGRSWSSLEPNRQDFHLLNTLTAKEDSDFEALLEPHQQKWLFFTDYPVASTPNLQFSFKQGLVNNFVRINQPFAYSLKVQPITVQTLSQQDKTNYLQLPKTANPRLNAWAKQQYQSLNNDPKAFILFLKEYIKKNNFWYTLHPPELNPVNQMDAFWFDTQKGYCSHYASAITLILRNAGIPARVIIGYQGGDWNSMLGYLTLQQKDAHAWLEYWQDGLGWQRLDPTTFIARQRIDESILSQQDERLMQRHNGSYSLSWWQQSSLLFDSARFFLERWMLFYNQDAQTNLLATLGLSHWDKLKLLQVSVGFFILFIGLLVLLYQWPQKNADYALIRQYRLLQREFKRFNVVTENPATFKQQCDSLINKCPALTGKITLSLHRYEQLRLQCAEGVAKDSNKETIVLFKQLRKQIRQYHRMMISKLRKKHDDLD